MLWTSYFSKTKTVDPKRLYAITYYKPSWFNGNYFPIVAPSEQLVKDYKKGIVTENGYVIAYRKYLNDNEQEILKQVSNLPQDSILLCFEGPGKFCHRHVLAKWLNEHNVGIEELDNI